MKFFQNNHIKLIGDKLKKLLEHLNKKIIDVRMKNKLNEHINNIINNIKNIFDFNFLLSSFFKIKIFLTNAITLVTSPLYAFKKK